MGTSERSSSDGIWARLDRRIYNLERSLITGALLVMTLTYFLQIVHREMFAEVNAFDRLLLQWRGYATIQEVPQDVLGQVTGWVTPAILGAIAFVMGMLAMRTRSRQGLEPGQAPPVLSWKLMLGTGAAVTAGCWVFLALVEQVPARWVCLTALVAVIAVALRRGLREARWASVAGTAAGGAAVAWFFFVKVDEGYIWGVELSSVLLMYVGFLGASMATRDNKHIQVDAVRRKMPLRWLHLYNMVGGLVTVGTCLLLCVLASEYVISQAGHGNTLEATQLPEVVVSLPIAVATGMMAIRFAVQTAGHLAAHLRGDEPSRPEAGAH